MAFRLNRRRSITTELEKLVHSEFQTAIKELDQPKPGARFERTVDDGWNSSSNDKKS